MTSWLARSEAARSVVRARVRVTVLLLATLLTAQAAAETGDPRQAAAEALFLEGRRLMKLEQYEAACRKFQESQRLDPATGTLMNLAQCSAKRGLTATAWALYREAMGLAQAAGQEARERVARREVEALELNLARVRLEFLPGTQRALVSLSLDGVPLSEDSWSTPTPIDPGAHVVEWASPAHRPRRLRFEIRAGEELVLELPPLEPLPTPPPRRAPREQGWRAQHTVALVQAVVGAGALVLGGVWAAQAKSEYDAAPDCDRAGRCAPSGLRAREHAIDRANLATVSASVGVSALIGAGIVWFTAPSLGPEARPEDRPSAGYRSVDGLLVGARGAW